MNEYALIIRMVGGKEYCIAESSDSVVLEQRLDDLKRSLDRIRERGEKFHKICKIPDPIYINIDYIVYIGIEECE